MNRGVKVSAAAMRGQLEVVLQGFGKLLGCAMLWGLGAHAAGVWASEAGQLTGSLQCFLRETTCW